ncbi:MAG: U32 family peptidase [Clostridia bacterium]|nr:U32 family peptidase [Clostridia bacterium]
MKKIEILAPVGGNEQLLSAVRSGADAVYFGASSFNARRNAENFTDEAFIGAVRYCHERGVKAYITLNTLIKDSEAEEFQKTLALIAKSGADAVILQDMGALSRVKKCCPDIPLHASTQLAVHNIAGAKLLEELGFSRIVLARELSIKEIKEITEAVNVEIEVFVHGAHCMSASGMCYMSSFIGARSGNRGLCAQPCRLNFKYGKREYVLSLKDMCLADMTDELIAAGVTSFKIEGRMKRPEYVAAAVTAYKNAVKGDTPDISLLQSVFSRSGFTKGYAIGKRDLSMFGYRTKEDVLSASDVLTPIANTVRNENPLIEISMEFILRENERARLKISDGIYTVEVSGEIPEKAIKAPLSSESVKKSLGKLGSTFYYAEEIKCTLDDGLMLRASDINAMRREAIEELTRKRSEKEPYSYVPFKKTPVFNSGSDTPALRLSFKYASCVPDNINADKIILPVKELLGSIEIIEKHKNCICAKLPSLIYPLNEEKILEDINKLSSFGVKYAYCDNIGAVALAKKAGMKILGGSLLNIINSDAAESYYELGVTDITLSPEISFKELKNIKTHCKKGIIAYGFLPLMHFRCCPLQSEKGCGECKGRGILTDRMGESFTVLCENRQFSVLYNTVPLYAGDKNIPDVDFLTLEFTTETPEDVLRIINTLKSKKALAGRKTAGLYEREIY